MIPNEEKVWHGLHNGDKTTVNNTCAGWKRGKPPKMAKAEHNLSCRRAHILEARQKCTRMHSATLPGKLKYGGQR